MSAAGPEAIQCNSGYGYEHLWLNSTTGDPVMQSCTRCNQTRTDPSYCDSCGVVVSIAGSHSFDCPLVLLAPKAEDEPPVLSPGEQAREVLSREDHTAIDKAATPKRVVAAEAFADALVIKTEPELRHVLAHLYYAIDHLVAGRSLMAQNELKSIEGLVFFDGDDDQYESWLQAKLSPKEGSDEKLQGT